MLSDLMGKNIVLKEIVREGGERRLVPPTPLPPFLYDPGKTSQDSQIN